MKVYFDGGFWGHRKYQKPMQNIAASKEFSWKGCQWRLLGVYVCGKGLVLDFAREVPVRAIEEFLRKYRDVILRQQQGEEPTDSEQAWMEYENPTDMSIHMKAWVNGREVNHTRSAGMGYCSPGVLEGAAMEAEAEELMETYRLEPSCGWSFYRVNLAWDYKRIPEKINLRLVLLQDSYHLPCEPAFETAAGETEKRITVTHPLDGTKHTLVVEGVRQETLPEQIFERGAFQGGVRYTFPENYQELQYHFVNEEDTKRFLVQDTERGDAPVRIREEALEGREPQAKGAAAVAIIGRASGPTSIFLAGKAGGCSGNDEAGKGALETESEEAAGCKKPDSLFQASRLCFEPVTRTRWQVKAVVRQGEEMTLEFDIFRRISVKDKQENV